ASSPRPGCLTAVRDRGEGLASPRRSTMLRRWLFGLLAGGLGVAVWVGSAAPPQAQHTDHNRLYYYHHHYYPHNYSTSIAPMRMQKRCFSPRRKISPPAIAGEGRRPSPRWLRTGRSKLGPAFTTVT